MEIFIIIFSALLVVLPALIFTIITRCFPEAWYVTLIGLLLAFPCGNYAGKLLYNVLKNHKGY